MTFRFVQSIDNDGYIRARAGADWRACVVQASDEVSAAGEAAEGSEHAGGQLRGPSPQRGACCSHYPFHYCTLIPRST